MNAHEKCELDQELQQIRSVMLDLHVRIDKLEKCHTRSSLSSSASDSSIDSIDVDWFGSADRGRLVTYLDQDKPCNSS